MLLPANFKAIIAENFYDKTVSLVTKSTNSTDGWVTETANTVTGTFKGNVQFDKLAEIRSELGITEQVDISITCDPSVSIEKGDLLQYDNVTYRAVSVLPFDSHKKIAGTKWA